MLAFRRRTSRLGDVVNLPLDGLTLAQASAECGLSASTLRVQIRNGRLAATKMGRDWIVARGDLLKYLAQRAPQGQRSSSEKAMPVNPTTKGRGVRHMPRKS